MPLLVTGIRTASILAVLAGLLAPLSFSPLNIWPLGIVSVSLLLALLQQRSPRQAGWLGWCYGCGFFGIGTSWIYVSIHDYGNAGPILAGSLTAIFVMGLALFFSLQCWIFNRFFRHDWYVLNFTALWILSEWLRGWIFTGFPWLYMGYAHVHTWLAGLAPLTGVFGVSFAVVLSGGLLFHLVRHCLDAGTFFTRERPRITFALCLLWTVSAFLQFIPWVSTIENEQISVGVVQANIDQDIKFNPRFIQSGIDQYEQMTLPLSDSDIIVWPETAIPMIYQQAGPVLEHFSALTSGNNSALVSGILYRRDDEIHNSIVSMGAGTGIYHKQKLVPFGEYVPLTSLFSNLIQLFDLPMSSLRPGPKDQDLLQAAGVSLAPYICYEIVYPDFVRQSARNAELLVTISNDTWFGTSWGPLQHLQMASMRALENGRYLIRATNNGVSALIDHRGNILARTEQFQAQTLQGNVRIMSGITPFGYLGSWPVLIICFAILAKAVASTIYRPALSPNAT